MVCFAKVFLYLKGHLQGKEAIAVEIILSGVVLHFLEVAVEEEFPCPCSVPQNSIYAWVFFMVPIVPLLLLSLVLLPDSRRWCSHKSHQKYNDPDCFKNCSCNCCPCEQMMSFTTMILKALIPSIIWTILLFLDGDYYACSNLRVTNESLNHTDCELKCTQPAQEVPPYLHDLCTKSRIIGGCLLIALLILVTIFCFIPRCMPPKTDTFYRFEYDYLYQTENEALIISKLKDKAVEKAEKDSARRVDQIIRSSTENSEGAARDGRELQTFESEK